MVQAKADEFSGFRVMLVTPTYGPVDPICAKDLRVAVMGASNHGVYWCGDGSGDRMGYSLTRNGSTQIAYEKEDIGGIMWVDSDIRPAPNSILSILASVRDFKAEFVTGIYHQRAGRNLPVIYDFDEETEHFRQYQGYPENTFMPVDGCGFGFVWTSRKLIRAIAEHPEFKQEDGWFPDKRDAGGYGEDLSFCYQARRAGFQLYANTSVQVGHLAAPYVVTRQDFLNKEVKGDELAKVVLKERKNIGVWGEREDD